MAISFKQILIDAPLVRQNPLANPISNTAEFLRSFFDEGVGTNFAFDETDINFENATQIFTFGVRWLKEIYGKTEEEAKTQIVRWLLGYSDAQIPGFLNCIGNYSGFPCQYGLYEDPDTGDLRLRAYTGDIFGDEGYFYINLTEVASGEGFGGITTRESFEALSLSAQWDIVVVAFSDSSNFDFDVSPLEDQIKKVTCETDICLFTLNGGDALYYGIEVPVFYRDEDKYICVLIAPDNLGTYILYDSDYPGGKILASDLRFSLQGTACKDFTANIEATGKGLTLEELASVPRLTKYFEESAPVGLSATKKHFIRVI